MLTCFTQCLGITCNNASSNDTMIMSLSEIITSFAGDSKRTQCFNHIITLVAKRLISQFDISKMDVNAAIDEAKKGLSDLTAGMDIEEMLTWSVQDVNDDDNDDNDNDKDKGQELEISAEARAKLNASMCPVKLVLVKVSPLNALCMPYLTQWAWLASKNCICNDSLNNDCVTTRHLFHSFFDP
jgi:hypothetical protein